MSYAAIYLWLLPPCFFLAYCWGAESKGRINNPQVHGKYLLPYLKTLYREGFKLMLYDHFQLHCPWSWETAKKHRVAWVRSQVVLYQNAGFYHKTLGRITLSMCDDPALADTIAYECFVFRSSFWLGTLVGLLLSPVPGLWVAFCLPIAGAISVWDQWQERRI